MLIRVRQVISHPADVMVSKLNADRKAGEGAGQALGRIYKNIGFSGLWNGLPVRWVDIAKSTRESSADFTSQNRDDRDPDCLPMVHLRLVQGVPGCKLNELPLNELLVSAQPIDP